MFLAPGRFLCYHLTPQSIIMMLLIFLPVVRLFSWPGLPTSKSFNLYQSCGTDFSYETSAPLNASCQCVDLIPRAQALSKGMGARESRPPPSLNRDPGLPQISVRGSPSAIVLDLQSLYSFRTSELFSLSLPDLAPLFPPPSLSSLFPMCEATAGEG